MQIQIHEINTVRIAEVISESIVVGTAADGLQVLVDLYYQDFDRIILHEKNITPAFFDLKTGVAGEVLQKFSNYRVRLVIVGGFDKYESKSLRDFIFECNRGNQVNFLGTVTEAVERLSK
jgi:hypothetical protein